MKKILSFLSLAAVVLFSVPIFASGVLIDVKGDVKITGSSGKKIDAKIGTELIDASKIVVAKNSAAAVLLQSGAVDKISSGQTYIVGKDVAKSRKSFGEGMTVAMRELSSKGKGPTIHGMVKDVKGPDKSKKFIIDNQNEIVALFPRQTSIRFNPKIEFSWNSKPAVNWQSPVIVIDDAQNQHIAVIDVPANSTAMSVDAVAAKLNKGESYSWYLATKNPALKGKTSRFFFDIISAEKESKLESEIAEIRALGLGEQATNVLIAQVCFAAGLYNEVVDLLLPIWRSEKTNFTGKLLWLSYTKLAQGKKASEFPF